MREAITRLRYRYWPDHWLGEILSKRWTETAIPVFVLLIVGFWLSQSINNFLSLSSLADTARQASEIGFILLAWRSWSLSAASICRLVRCSR